MPNFFVKEKYVPHYKNLQLYLRLGLKLKRIHRVLELNQSQWLKPCIEFNTEKINENTVFGKTMENFRNRIEVKLANNEKKLFKIYTKIKLYVAQNI